MLPSLCHDWPAQVLGQLFASRTKLVASGLLTASCWNSKFTGGIQE